MDNSITQCVNAVKMRHFLIGEEPWPIFFFFCIASVIGKPPADVVTDLAAKPSDYAGLLETLGMASWPAWIAEVYAATTGFEPRQEYFAWQSKVRRQQNERLALQTQVQERLAKAGIESLSLKGAFTAPRLYPSSDLRVSNDIDLLLALPDSQHLVSLLGALDFLPTTPQIERFNFEWTFRHKSGLLLDLHFDLCPTWRIPWRGAAELLATKDEQRRMQLHAWHALAHFAQHKGFLRPIQELDLLLFEARGLLANVPTALQPAQRLWRSRFKAFWQGETSGHTPWPWSLVYRAERWNPIPNWSALRHRSLGFLLSTRKLGWLGQAIGLKI